MLIFEERGNRSTQRKTSRSKGKTQPTNGIDTRIWTRATVMGGECSYQCTTLALWALIHHKMFIQLNLHQWPPLYNGHPFLADSPYIDSGLNLSTMAMFFFPIRWLLWRGSTKYANLENAIHIKMLGDIRSDLPWAAVQGPWHGEFVRTSHHKF